MYFHFDFPDHFLCITEDSEASIAQNTIDEYQKDCVHFHLVFLYICLFSEISVL